MAQSVIGALRVNLGLDSAQFERGARRTRDPLRQMRSQFLAVSAAAAAMGAALSLAVRSGLQDVDRVAKAARTIDGTTGALRALELAAGDAGVSQSDVTNAAQRMTREIARAAREGGRGADAIGRLGLEASELADLDADERMAAIADRVRELGLSSGETMDLLRDLGVRSEEMALLMTQGGGAIRAARREVEQLGLSLSEDAERQIERTNDALSRISLSFQAFRNRLAAQVAPALERLANAFVEAMQEGGALRRVLDFLADNIERIVAVMGSAVAVFGVRYVGALAAARAATIALTLSTQGLRAALTRVGLGIPIVLLGELAFRMSGLAEAAGEVEDAAYDAEAATAALNTALGTFYKTAAPSAAREAILTAASNRQLAAAARDAAASELAKAEAMAAAAGRGGMAGPGARGQAQADADLAEAQRKLKRAEAALDRANREADRAARSVTGAMSERMEEGAESTQTLRLEIEGLDDSLSSIGGGGGGGSAGEAIDGIDTMTDSLERAEFRVSRFEDASRRAFVGFVSGADSARQAASRLLDSFARILANQAFTGLFGGLFGGGSPMSFTGGLGPGTLPVPSFAGGGFTGHGPRTGGVDGLGGFPAILHPGETVRDHRKGGGQDVRLIVELRGDIDARIAQGAENVVIRRKPQIVNESVGAAVEMNREKRVFE